MDQAGHRRDVDDHAAALCFQQRCEHAATTHDAEQIDVDDPLPVVHRCFVDRAALRDAGIVEQQIDAAELFDHLFARADQVRIAAHVTMDVERLSTERTQRAQRLCAARVIEIADADAAAVARVVFGQCTAEPGCAAGDENALTLHPSLSFSSCADSLAYLPSSTRAIMPRRSEEHTSELQSLMR